MLGCKAAIRSGAQAAIDAGKLLRRRLIFAGLQAGIQLKRKLGKFVLDVGRPRLDPLQNLGQFRCLHRGKVTPLHVVVSTQKGLSLSRNPSSSQIAIEGYRFPPPIPYALAGEAPLIKNSGFAG